MDNKFPMKAVSLRTNLSPHVIRVWEKRYQAVTPKRSPTNRRLYSEEDVERLLLLRRATELGHSIGQIARLPREELIDLLGNAALRSGSGAGMERGAPAASRKPVDMDELFDAVKRFDVQALEQSLSRAEVTMSRPQLIEKVIVPLIYKVGEGWHSGELRIAHEHLATSVIRSFVGNLNGAANLPPSAPCVIVTTPAGQIHEMGALVVSATALSMGWRVIYLGPNLPAEEICAATEQNNARLVALSLVYPSNDLHLRDELVKLRRLLPEETKIVVGGRAASGYRDILDTIGAEVALSIAELNKFLEIMSIQQSA
jgi:DNA-binding transcriptional MerR regulator/methylmalonyl-CoA mutase cobalamin-binding subunit